MDFKDFSLEDKPSSIFNVKVYGNFEKYNSVISKARVRIFYKGDNRNNTYISEEFSENLLKTLPYAPIGGIYNEDDNDFTDHGKERSEAQIYGVVPENPNIAWETHLDDDGVERDYACADVLLFTTRLPEANSIIGKSQSMELHKKSIKGEWKFINNKRQFHYSDACFIGLMALGDNTEPCFEGSAFFTFAAVSVFQSLIEEVRNLIGSEKLNEKKEGGIEKMPKTISFKLSDNQKHSAIWGLLNPNCNEESGYQIDFAICEIYEDYALCYQYETNSYFRVSYQKNDEDDSVIIGDKLQTYIMDISQNELEILKKLKEINNNSFEKVDEIFSQQGQDIITLTEEKNVLTEEKNSLVVEKDTFTAEKITLEETITTLNEEKNLLEKYKLELETSEKEKIIEKYSLILDEAIISKYSDLAKYTAMELKKELSFEVTESKPEMFTKENEQDYIPKGDFGSLSGAARLVAEQIKQKEVGGNK